jgi:hypothetical protein
MWSRKAAKTVAVERESIGWASVERAGKKSQGCKSEEVK